MARTILSRRSLSTRASRILSAVGLPTDGSPIDGVYDGQWKGSGPQLVSRCPATGEVLGTVNGVGLFQRIIRVCAEFKGSEEETRRAIEAAKEAGRKVRDMPAPKRGELVRQIREALAEKVNELGDLVSLEMGKIKSEGKGEVQEVSILQ